ncbi:hypothetical protein ABIA35_003474 [Catenulispora sp. MAP12-49]
MSVRPRPGAEVPELAARVARAATPKGTTGMWLRDRPKGLWSDEDFAGWYPRDGRVVVRDSATGVDLGRERDHVSVATMSSSTAPISNRTLLEAPPASASSIPARMVPRRIKPEILCHKLA